MVAKTKKPEPVGAALRDIRADVLALSRRLQLLEDQVSKTSLMQRLSDVEHGLQYFLQRFPPEWTSNIPRPDRSKPAVVQQPTKKPVAGDELAPDAEKPLK